jgi:hypothetical protein
MAGCFVWVKPDGKDIDKLSEFYLSGFSIPAFGVVDFKSTAFSSELQIRKSTFGRTKRAKNGVTGLRR